MFRMFSGATAFDQNLANWYVVQDPPVLTANAMFPIRAQNSYLDGLVSTYSINDTRFVMDDKTLSLNSTNLPPAGMYPLDITAPAVLGEPNAEEEGHTRTLIVTVSDPPAMPFITTWTASVSDYGITLPMVGTYSVLWGDGSNSTNVSGSQSHTYGVAGDYAVTVLGDGLEYIRLHGDNVNALQLKSIDQWGDTRWTTMDKAFYGARNMVYNATDSPDLSGVTDMHRMFHAAAAFNGDLSSWDVSSVTDMSSMFRDATSFDQPLNTWDVSSVTNMHRMFDGATSFNGDLSSWDVSAVTDMSNMFIFATSFNGNLSSWDVSKVTDMSSMFDGATSFNQPLNAWDVSSVTEMDGMFYYASVFNHPLNDWDVSSVTNMNEMFRSATFFNQPLNSWDVSKVTDMSDMFIFAYDFNGNLSSWDVSSVTNMNEMFAVATSFNGNLSSWDVSAVTDMSSMFDGTTAFNGNLSSWDVSAVTDMSSMFDGTTAFNGDLSSWDVSSVTTMFNMFNNADSFDQPLNSWDVSSVDNMDDMFNFATAFSQNLGEWYVTLDPDTIADTGIPGVVGTISAQNQPLKNHFPTYVIVDGLDKNHFEIVPENQLNMTSGVSGKAEYSVNVTASGGSVFESGNNWRLLEIKVTDQTTDTTLPADAFVTTWKTASADQSITINFVGDDMNISWGDGATETNLSGSQTHTYTNAGNYTVSVTGGLTGLTLDRPDSFGIPGLVPELASIDQWGGISWTNMSNTFAGASNMTYMATDTPDLSLVTDMSDMFRSAYDFNGDLSSWDVSSVTDMSEMFYYATSFNQPLNAWDVSSVIDMFNMFSGATAFNQPLNDWDVSSVTEMDGMFAIASSFNQPLNDWDVSSVTDMAEMFYYATSFNQTISSWNVSSVNSMDGMFEATSFNQPLNSWDVSSVNSMDGMFGDATAFDQPLNAWDVSSVTDMFGMFSFADSFNQPLNSWDVSSVTNMEDMFGDATSFNQPLNSWDVSRVTNMNDMFYFATAFDQNLANWYVVQDPPVLTANATFSIRAQNSYLDGLVSTYSIDDTRFVMDDKTLSLNSTNLPPAGMYPLDITAPAVLGEPNAGEEGHTRTLSVTVKEEHLPFITTWRTESADQSITINFVGSDMNISWGDGATETNLSGSQTHTYTEAGNHTVSVTGGLTGLTLDRPDSFGIPGLVPELASIDQWGGISWTNMSNTFAGASNMVYNATDTPDLSLVTDMSDMFQRATSFDGDLSSWDVSSVTDMSNMFQRATSFDGDLSSWDVSSVTDMSDMFAVATSFNQPLNNWDVSSVTDMTRMFAAANFFNQTLNDWDVSSVIYMSAMFFSATAFDQPLNVWDVSSVTAMDDMFAGATAFDQPLNAWDVSAVTDMTFMFIGASSFDQPLNNWDVSKVTSMASMFFGTSSFNQPLNDWDVSSVTTMFRMFLGATSFNQTLNSWDVSSVTGMRSMFAGATSFDQPLNSWNVSSVNNMNSMFNSASSFNQSLNSWDVSSVTVMSYMFNNATSFNQPLNSWDVSSVTDMARMFNNADSFNQTLNSWDVSSVTDMFRMFNDATSFNQPLNSWNVSKVTSMFRMFTNADSFNQPLNSWNVSRVTNMDDMFNFATAFSQNLGEWYVTLDPDTIAGTGIPGVVGTISAQNQPLKNHSPTYVIVDGLDKNHFEIAPGNQLNMTSGVSGKAEYSVNVTASGSNVFEDGNNWRLLEIKVTDQTTDTTLPADAFVTTWKTESADQSITINFVGSGMNISWGDGATETNLSGSQTHTYTEAGNHTVSVTGGLTGLTLDRPDFFGSPIGPVPELASIDQWGGISWTNMSNTFAGASNMTYMATDTPDLSLVTDMSDMFQRATSFDGDLSSWDVSSVTDMSNMFQRATSFDGDLSSWDVSSVTDMHRMFDGATSFNGDLSSWDVTKVTDMSYMFIFATSFNGNLSSWDVSAVTDMSSMFDGATSFDQPLNAWGVSSVTAMSYMFSGATSFDRPLNTWDVSSVTDMSGMFNSASSFNQPLNSWNVSSTTDMTRMFSGATSFDRPLDDWNVSSTTDMTRMFGGATSFDQPLNSWNVSSVNSMNSMFIDATSFDRPLNTWDVSSVTTMFRMFTHADSFNQPLNDWDVSSVDNMADMFSFATSFDQNLGEWYVTLDPDTIADTGIPGVVGTISAQNQPLKNHSPTYVIVDGLDKNHFEIAPGNQLNMTSGVSGKAEYSVNVAASGSNVFEDGNNWRVLVVKVSGDINAPPVLNTIDDQTVNEFVELTFTATASDDDSLTFSFDGTFPSGAAITDDGNFTWTPTELQDGDHTITVQVTDGSLTDSETLTVTVNEVNVAPVLNAIGDKGTSELVELTFTATASDTDVVDNVVNTLTFSFDGTFPSGAAITDDGNFTWTPTESQVGSHDITVQVTDGSLTDSETLTVTVRDVNVAPVLNTIDDQTVNEFVELTFTATASDDDSLTFSFDGTFPSGAAITDDGNFTWTPTELQDGDHTITVQVTDGSLTDSETLTVTVNEVNVAPVLNAIGDKGTSELVELTFTATASDTDVVDNVVNTLTFSFDGTFPSGAAITDDGNFTWTPTELQDGDHTITVQVTDGSLTDSETLTVTVRDVNVAPVLNTIDDQTVNEFVELTFTATASDDDSLTFSFDGTFPSGAAITDDGNFTWTPTELQDGDHIITVQVTDGSLTDSETLTVTVNEVNVAPVLNAIGDKGTSELVELTFTATASDTDVVDNVVNTLTFSFDGTFPSGAAITDDGNFTWTPTESQDGDHIITVQVTDGSLTDSETLTVTVNEVNVAPVLNAIGDKGTSELVELTFTATASDTDVVDNVVNTLTFSFDGTFPSGAAITDDGNFTWTPTELQDGDHTITVQVTDGSLTDSETLTVTVNEVNVAPVLNAIGDKGTSELVELTFTATASDTDVVDNVVNTLTFSFDGTFPSGAAITDDGNFTWTPTESQDGDHTITVQVTDGSLTDSETLTVTVNEVNVAPVLNTIDDQTVNEFVELTFTATASDDDSLTFSFDGTFPSGAAITDDGNFTWTPTESQDGDHTITVQVTDGSLTDSETLTVTVNEVNVAPVLNAIGDKGTSELVELTFTATASDTDVVDNVVNTLTFSFDGTFPSGAAITDDGNFTWTPTESQDGDHTITVQVTDGSLTDSETLTVTVRDVNVAPVLNTIDDQTVNEFVELTFTATASDDDSLTFSFDGTFPSGAAITDDGNFTWTPTESQDGDHTITVQVTDGSLTDSETLTVTVNEVNVAPVLNAIGDKGTSELVELTFTATASDTDVVDNVVNTLTFSFDGTFPSGAAITDDGNFTWTPTESQDGDHTITVQVTDGSLTDSETLTVTVRDVNVAPVLNTIDDQTVNEFVELTFTATASDDDSLTFSFDGTFPSGAAITDDGNFTWTPTESQDGDHTITVQVTDGSLTDSETLTVTVNEVNVAPVLNAIGDKGTSELVELTFTATASDTDVVDNVVNTLTFSFDGTFPSGAAITSAGVFTWTPTESQDGDHTITVQVTDGSLTDSETLTVTVKDTTAPVTTLPADAFITTWRTDSANQTITIPVGGSTARYSIDWGDNSPAETDITGDSTHTYREADSYTVSISGGLERIYLDGQQPNAGRLASIEQWGDTRWTTMDAAFYGARNMVYNAADSPDLSTVTDMSGMFGDAIAFNGDLSSWDVSKVTDMSDMFIFAYDFNGNLSSWDVSSVTNMNEMFAVATSFNGDLSSWDVSKVTDMSDMFIFATSFNGNLSSWDVSAVTDMSSMFDGTTAFNGDLSSWDVSSVTDMNNMFYYDTSFNQPLNDWDVSSVTEMDGMFFYTPSFTQNLGNWYVTLDPDTIADTGIPGVVGTISAQNQPLKNHSPTYVIVDGLDKNHFEIVPGNQLNMISGVSGKAEYSVNVTASGSNVFEDGNNWRVLVVKVSGDINAPPVLNIIDDQTVNEFVELTFTATASDDDSLTFSFDGTFPSGAAITDDGNFTWTPTELQDGDHTITVQVTDGSLTDSETLTVTVNEVNVAPVLNAIGDKGTSELVELTFTATASDTDVVDNVVNTLTFSFDGTFPSGAAITDDGNFTWTPTESQDGDHTITVQVTDGSLTDSETLTVTVNEVNVAPVLNTIDDQTVNEFVELTFTATASDDDSLTFSFDGTFPSGAAITDDGNFTWTPTESQDGDHTITVQVTDGSLTDSETLTVTVNEVNVAPVLNAIGDKGTSELVELTFTATASDTDVVDNVVNTLTFSFDGTFPSGAAITDDGNFTWTPTELQDGDHTITVQVTDGSLTDSETLTVTVNEVNVAPVLNTIDDQTVNEFVELTFTATASDDDSLTFSFDGTFPSGAAITDDGNFTWTPTESQDGDHTITVQVTDGSLTDSETLTVTVNEVNVAPVLNAIGDKGTSELVELTFTATASDTDVVDNVVNTLTFSFDGTFPSGAAITDDGNFTWTPTESQDGDHTITVQVTDGSLTDSETLTVTVNEVNVAPVLNTIDDQTVNEFVELTFTATASDDDSLTFSFDGTFPSGAAITDDGNFTWTPTESQDGDHTITVQVTDGSLTDSETLTVTVNEVNVAPVLNAIGDKGTSELVELTFTATASDTDVVDNVVNTLTFSFDGTFPSGAAITDDGNFTWTPTESQDGDHTITVQVTDGSLTDSETLTVTVRDVNVAPVLNTIDDQTVNEFVELTFTATASDDDSLTFSFDGTFPSGAAITDDGNFTWTPTESQDGDHTITVQVTDGSLTDSETLTVTVNEVNVAPVLNAIGDKGTSELVELTFTATASDTDVVDNVVNTLTFSFDGTFPLGAAITDDGNFTWTPTESQDGDHTITVQVTDGSLTDSETLTVTVKDTTAPVTTLPADAFITTWRTDSANQTITIPVGGSTARYSIDWGDNSPAETDITGDSTHTYREADSYTVSISGGLERIYLDGQQPNAGRLASIEQWGDTRWTTMDAAFYGARNMVYNAADSPDLSTVTDMSGMFGDAIAFNGDLSSWDVSKVTDMSDMFIFAYDFNGNLSSWDVSSVTNMNEMFAVATSFNGDLSSWDVSKVTDMSDMFIFATSFNGNLSSWDVSAVTDMSSMFDGTTAFNGDLSSWDVSSVTDMNNMFYYDTSFNQPLNDWDVSSVTEMDGMFFYTPSFTQNLGNWYVTLDPDTIADTGIPGVVGTISAQNQPLKNHSPTYVIVDGLDKNHFEIVPGNQLNMISGVSGKAEYSVNVTASGSNVFEDGNNWRVLVVKVSGDINAPPVLNIIDDQTVNEFVELTFTATASDDDSLTFSFDGTFPSGAAITDDGNFTWTPTESQDGDHTITVQVTDGSLTDSETLTVTVNEVNVAPVLNAIGDKGTSELVELTFTATASDTDVVDNVVNTLTFSFDGTFPLGAAITDDGNFTWTPTESQVGSHDITVQVTDGSLTDSETLTVTVRDVNVAPVLNTIDDQTVNEFVELTFTATASDDDSLTFSFDGTFPSGAAITDDGNFTWTPTESQDGDHTITVQVTDGSLTDSETLTVTVNEVNVAPVLNAIGDKGTSELVELTFTATASDTDVVDNVVNTLTFSFDGTFPLGAAITDDGNFTWTPTESQDGDHTITVQVTDGSLTDSETLTVTVNEVNVAPVLNTIDDQTVNEFVELTFTATASDDDSLTFSFDGTFPSGAAITDDGNFTWTPTESQDGDHTITVQVTDGSLTDSETLTVTVNEVNVAPVLNAIGDKGTSELVELTFTATASDTDVVDNVVNTLTFSFDGTFPSGAAITDDGNFTWTPTESQDGDHTITVQVTDGSLTDSETLTVTVRDVNVAPVLNTIDDQTVNEFVELTFTATASDDDSLTFSFDGTFPSGAAITDDGNFTWTPTESQDGDHTITVQVTDGSLTDSETLTVTVNEVNVAPVLNAIGDKGTSELVELTFTATASDTDVVDNVVNTLTFSFDGTFPLGAAITDDGNFTWTPTESQDGDHTITVQVTDGSLTDSETLTVTVKDTTAPVTTLPADAFITTWRTDSANQTITIPVGGSTARYSIDWGDNSPAETDITGDSTHTYREADSYTVSISGGLERIYLDGQQPNAGRLASIEQWGDTRWTTMDAAFYGARNMVYNAADSPDLSTVTDMSGMFGDAIAFNGDLSSWDVSKVTDMSDMFIFAYDFNGNLSSWDVSSVTNMNEMFAVAISFNGDLSSWDVSKVTDMSDMFIFATSFNGNLSSWDVSAVTDMSSMFDGTTAFNGDLSSWDVSSVTDMNNMFYYDTSFNQPLNDWDVSSVTEMDGMFFHTPSFTQNLGNWYVVANATSIARADVPGVVAEISAQNDHLNGHNPTYGISSDNDYAFFEIVNGNKINMTSVGTKSSYMVNVTASGSNVFEDGNNWRLLEIKVTGQTTDTTPPVIKLEGSSLVTITVDDTYTEQGAVCDDDVDADKPATVGGDTVDTSTAGQYTVTYDCTDTAGNVATQVLRTVNVQAESDTDAPVIIITGLTNIQLTVDDTYTEQGAVCDDDVDVDKPATVGGDTVDTSTVGQYTVTYDCTDSSNNEATQVSRTVNVVST